MTDDRDQFEFNFDAPKEPEAPRPSLIQPEESKRITKEAIERAERLTDDHRKIEYLQAIRAVAERMEFFRADHVWDYLGEVGDGERDNGSGLGPMMKIACASGIMRAANEFERSQRGSMHGKPQRLWKSLIYRATPPAQNTEAAECPTPKGPQSTTRPDSSATSTERLRGASIDQ